MLRELAGAIADSGGTAHLLRAPSLDASQEAEFRALFDRGDDYANFVRALADARKTISGQSAADLTRLLRRLRKDYETMVAIDYFPDDAATRAKAAWQDFVALVDTVLSPGEPHPAQRTIRLLPLDGYQGRTCAYPAHRYLIPDDTLTLADARKLGVRSVRDLYGGVVPFPFVATKLIAHDTVTALQTQILPEAHKALSNLDNLSRSVADVAARIDRDPSIVIRGTAPPAPGPGERK